MATHAPVSRTEPSPTVHARAAEELARLPYEPLLPAGIKLIVSSLALGVGLLVALVGVTR